MAAKVSFDAYMGWVNITNPNQIPEDARVIGANDLLRYEQLGKDAAAKFAEIDTTIDGWKSDTIISDLIVEEASETRYVVDSIVKTAVTAGVAKFQTKIDAFQVDVNAVPAKVEAQVPPLVAKAIAADTTVAAAAADAVGAVVASGGITSALRFKSFANLTFSSFSNPAGTFTYVDKVLSARGSDPTKYYCVTTAADVTEALVIPGASWLIIGTGAATAVAVNVAAPTGPRAMAAFTPAGTFTALPSLESLAPVVGKQLRIVYTATTVTISYANANGWTVWANINRATYGITGSRPGLINHSSITGSLTIEGVPATNNTGIVPSTIPVAPSAEGERFLLLADETSPSNVSKIKATDLNNSGALTFASEARASFALAINPGGNYVVSYNSASTLLDVHAVNPGNAGAPYAVALNSQELVEVTYRWDGLTPTWFIVGADDAGRAYMVNPKNDTSNRTVYRINLDGSITSVGSVASVSGADLRGARVRIAWKASTVELFEWVGGAWVLWRTLDKASTGITKHRAGAASGAGPDQLTQHFRVLVSMKGAPVSGRYLDRDSIPNATAATLDPADAFLLGSSETVSQARKISATELFKALGSTSGKWAGKRIYLFGDSISSTDYPWYGQQLAARTGAIVEVGGRSGATVAGLTNNAWLDAVVAFAPDLVVCMTAGNDRGTAGTVGSFIPGHPTEPLVTDPDPARAYIGTRYIEAAAYIVQYLRRKMYADARRPQIVYLNGTPQRRFSHSLTEDWNNPANHERKAAAIREICTRYHVPYMDMLALCGWDMSLEPFWTSPTDKSTNNGVYTMDGLHPNEAGYARMADAVAAFINTI